MLQKRNTSGKLEKMSSDVHHCLRYLFRLSLCFVFLTFYSVLRKLLLFSKNVFYVLVSGILFSCKM